MILVAAKTVVLLVLSVAGYTALSGKPLARADEITMMYLNYLPNRLTLESGEQYDLLLEELLPAAHIEVELQTAPLGRARTLFMNGENSCLFPTGTRLLDDEKTASDFIGSDTVDFFSLRLYTTKGGKTYSSIDELKTGRFGYISNSGSIRLIKDLAKDWIPIPSEDQLITMLELGRLDGFIGHHPDTVIGLSALGKSDLLQVSPLTIGNAQIDVIFLCHNTPHGRNFIASVNQQIADFKASGRLRQILGPHADIPNDNPGNPKEMVR